jgi:hypothetical protein
MEMDIGGGNMRRMIEDYIGEKIHHLTILEDLGTRLISGTFRRYIRVQCDCENKTIQDVRFDIIFHKSKPKTSCGCLGKIKLPKRIKPKKKVYNINDYLNKKFNKLFIVEQRPTRNYIKRVLALCDCGTYREIPLINIITGHTKSCGCYNLELLAERCRFNTLKHGLTGTTEYISWRHMLSRCYNTNNLKYPIYGGRGITVCERWLNSFENFFEDMGNKPKGTGKSHYTLGRIDNDGNYTPENCEWQTPEQQSNNRSSCKSITIDGVTLNRTQWIKKLGLNYNTVVGRISKGWSEYDAITTPIGNYNCKK